MEYLDLTIFNRCMSFLLKKRQKTAVR